MTVTSSSVKVRFTDIAATEDRYWLIRGGSTIMDWHSALDGMITYTDTGLQPDTEYWYQVFVSNAGGNSSVGRYVRTKPVSGGETHQYTHTYYLIPQPKWQGAIPFKLTWNPGPPNNAYLKTIKLSSYEHRTLHLMKEGQDWSGCGGPPASVTLAGGETTSAAEITALFGTAKPHPPISMVACVTPAHAGDPVTSFPITITYVRE